MFLFVKRAFKDILENSFVSSITIVIIGLIILIISTFLLFLDNAAGAISDWKSGIRIMVYLQPGTNAIDFSKVKKNIQEINLVNKVRFISKEEALAILRKQLNRQGSLLDNLKENPLPDAFDVQVASNFRRKGPDLDEIEAVALKIESIPGVQQVEYGQKWIERFSAVFDLFRLVGLATAGLFVMAGIFIIANTIRLVLYARQDELEIMRLVGASEWFIKTPFYIQAIIQGGLGAFAGMMVLYFGYQYLNTSDQQGLSFINIHFLSMNTCLSIMIASMILGWLGCYLSLKQFLRK